MLTKSDWDERYKTGNLPWDTGRHDPTLELIIGEFKIGPCRTLEFGCGTGTNAIWLAQQGFDVTAIDISSLAIAAAREKVAGTDLKVAFLEGSVLAAPVPNGPFDFVFDRGALHSLEDVTERRSCAARLADNMSDGGIWLSMLGSADSPPRDVGPPRLTARDIADAVEESFEIRLLRAVIFDSDAEHPAPAWACLLKKRQ
jgi:SAM-dependent methyltransferase